MGIGRVIAFAGPPGSGKTVLSARTAAELAGRGLKTVLICFDNTVPSVPILFPDRKFSDLKSIGEVLMALDVDGDSILKSAMTTESDPNLICLGYLHGENSRTYPAFSPARTARLFEAAASLADFVIADIKADFLSDPLSETALIRADKRVSVYNPDIRTLSYYSSAGQLFPRIQDDRLINVLNTCRNDVFPTEDEMKGEMKKVDVTVPYSREICRNLSEGALFSRNGGKKFDRSVKELADLLITEVPDER